MLRTTTSRLSALALTLLLATTACSDDSGSDPGPDDSGDPTSDAADDDRSPAEVLDAAVDTTLSTARFTIDYSAELQASTQMLSLAADGRVDYDTTIADVSLSVDQGGETQEVTILSDGTTAWVSATGGQVPPFPDGATYLAGDASTLAAADSFSQDGLLGVLYVLRSGDDAEAGDTGEADGVDTRTFTYTVAYADAVEAAGDDAEAFQTAFNLTGAGEQADLDVTVEIGSDDVVRTLALEIDGGDVPVGGGYDLSLTDVGADVEPPEAPADDEVASGPEADALFEQLLS